MPKELPKTTCDICRSPFRYGTRYDGHVVERYQITVCRRCYDSNASGWSPAHEAMILGHLKARGLSAPSRNAKELLPRD